MKKTIITIISLLFLIVLFGCENSDKLSRREFEKIVDENIEYFDFANAGLDLKKYEFLRSKTDAYEGREYDYVHVQADKKISNDEYLSFDGYYEIKFDLYDQEKVFYDAYEEQYLDGYPDLPSYVEVRDKSIEGHYELDDDTTNRIFENFKLDITYLENNNVYIDINSSYINESKWWYDQKEVIYSGEAEVKGLNIKKENYAYYLEIPAREFNIGMVDYFRIYFANNGSLAGLAYGFDEGFNEFNIVVQLSKK